ncbi:MAG: butyrate kinase, partial [Peptostreptococcaceae bacterium]
MDNVFKILTINPGSTSTKIAVFDNEELVFEKTLRHSSEEIGQYKKISDQFEFRKKVIEDSLEEGGVKVSELHA